MPDDSPVRHEANRRDPAEVLEAFLEALPRDMIAAVRENTAEELTWWFPESLANGEIWRSRAEALERLAATHGKNFESGSMVITERRLTLVTDAHAVAEFDLAARLPSGKDYANTYVFVVGFDGDGLINCIREHMDTKRIFDSMSS
jgi:ketosteroid isomerase-like protein